MGRGPCHSLVLHGLAGAKRSTWRSGLKRSEGSTRRPVEEAEFCEGRRRRSRECPRALATAWNRPDCYTEVGGE